jgi:hypothetical protein
MKPDPYRKRIELPAAKTPATAPVMRQASVAANRALSPIRDRSLIRDGANAAVPPTKLTRCGSSLT